MMRKHFLTLSLLSPLMLAACGSSESTVAQKLGLEKEPPDEFAVVTRAPLSVPPDFTLRPPRPGEDRPMEISVREQARQTVFGAADTSSPRDRSGGEDAFLSKLGAKQADPSIRQTLNTEMKDAEEDARPVAEKLLFMKDSKPRGKTIDPVEEKKRLEAKAPPKDGSGVTVQKRNEDILSAP